MNGLFQVFWSWVNGASARTPGIQLRDPISGRLTTRNVTAETALQLSAAFACIRLIAETVAGLPLNFYEVKGESKTLIQYHPLQNLLTAKPNRYQTKVEFFETLLFQIALHGNGYHVIERDSKGNVFSLMPIMTPQVQTVLELDGSITHRYNSGRGLNIFADESIWHNKLFGNGIVGISPLEYARNSLGIAMSAEDRVSTMANNGFKPTGVLTIDKVLKPEQRESIRKQFSDLAEGGGDSLRVLEAGLAYQQISMNPKDVQLLESRQFQTEDIARFFNVPSLLINDSSANAVKGAGITEIIQTFYKVSITPYTSRIQSSIINKLLDISERRVICPEFDMNSLYRGDEKSRFESYQTAIRSGVKTPNECRKAEGLAADTNGDKLFIDRQLVFLKDGGNPNVKNTPTTN